MTPLALHGFYDFRLIALPVAIAILSPYAVLALTGRIASAEGRVRVAWMCVGGHTMGTVALKPNAGTKSAN